MSYWRFAAMIATSTVVMYGLMYLNTYALEHVFWSETRLWMAVVMGAAMTVIMLGFMIRMYSNKTRNLAIFGGAMAAFALALWLVRSQATVDDVEYMHAMIPHHSIAIMTSKRAQISDPRVRKLADEIVEAQEREIAEMKHLAADVREREPIRERKAPRIVSAREALAGADIPAVDPHTMNDAEIAKAIGAGPLCTFRYTSTGNPVLAFHPQASESQMSGIVKLNGSLVPLHGSSRSDGFAFAADEVSITLEPEDERGNGSAPVASRPIEAQMVFRIGERLRVGYDGYYACSA